MKNRRTSLLALVLGAGILMGHPGTASAQTETSVFEIEYMDEEAVYNVLRLFGAGSTFDTNSRTVVARADARDMPTIERVLDQLDIPQPRQASIELTTHVLVATRTAGQGADLPASLSDVVGQLEGVLPYGSYNLMDTVITRVLDGNDFDVVGILPAMPGEPEFSPTYTFRGAMQSSATGDGQRTLRIDPLQFNATVWVSRQPRNVQIGTSVEFSEGRNVVVGKASVGSAALILVMSAQIVE